MRDTIWWDSESYNGRGWKSEWGSDQCDQGTQLYYGPTSKRSEPCDGCSNYKNCMDAAVQCQAFRNWINAGNYKDKDVLRNLKQIS